MKIIVQTPVNAMLNEVREHSMQDRCRSGEQLERQRIHPWNSGGVWALAATWGCWLLLQ